MPQSGVWGEERSSRKPEEGQKVGEPPQCMTPSSCAPHLSSSALRQAGDLCERVSPLHVQLSDNLPCGRPRAALEVTPQVSTESMALIRHLHLLTWRKDRVCGPCTAVSLTQPVSPLKAGDFVCLGRASGLHPHPWPRREWKAISGAQPRDPWPLSRGCLFPRIRGVGVRGGSSHRARGPGTPPSRGF